MATTIIQQSISLAHTSGTWRPLSASLSIDQDSPVWIADILLADVTAYQSIGFGDALTLTINGVAYSLICDGKALSRSDIAPGLTVKAISPVALKGAAFSSSIVLGSVNALGMAQDTVAELVAPLSVDWSIVDWLLPNTAASLESAPLDLARQIVAAAGGLLESARDGSIIVRPVYPVDIPDFPAHQASATALTDADLLSVQDSLDPSPRYDRWTIVGEDFLSSQASLQLSEESEGGDPETHRVRAWPWPWRTITLAHTGDSNTTITQVGVVTEEYEELVEIQSGDGTLAHPASALLSATYQHVDLGAMASVDGTVIRTTLPDYSLVWVRYEAMSWQWLVNNPVPETIQFLAVE